MEVAGSGTAPGTVVDLWTANVPAIIKNGFSIDLMPGALSAYKTKSTSMLFPGNATVP